MSLSNCFKDYTEEIDLALIQNACVEIELYSIIAFIVRERANGSKISLRDVSNRRRTEVSKRYYGKGGFPDFVVLERNKVNDAAILGCVEVKMPTVDISTISEQVQGHIVHFGKVLYSNGIRWSLYDKSAPKNPVWTFDLGKYDNKDNKIVWNGGSWNDLLKELDAIQWTE